MADKLRILLVEDETIVAMMVEGMLADLGYEHVATAGHLAEAMQMAGELQLDGAVLDVNLHGKPSFGVAEILRGRGVRIVFATGYGIEGLAPAWRETPVLSKPFEMRELKAVLDKAFAR